MDTEGMDKWEKMYKKHEVIKKFPIQNGMDREIDYLYIKMPVNLTDREVVQEKKVWQQFNGNPSNMLIVQRSTTNSKYPIQEKPIRADLIVSGMYLKEVSPQETLFYSINHLDNKMTTGKADSDNQLCEREKLFLPNLIKAISEN